MDEQVTQILSKYPRDKQEGLLPILQDIQAEKGYLNEEVLSVVSVHLNLPVNKIYGVAAFFDQFCFHPRGRYHFQICQGTSCYLLGATTLLEELEKQLKIKAGNVSRNGKFSLEIVTCTGACSKGPMMRVNETWHTHITPHSLAKIIHSLKEKKE